MHSDVESYHTYPLECICSVPGNGTTEILDAAPEKNINGWMCDDDTENLIVA